MKSILIFLLSGIVLCDDLTAQAKFEEMSLGNSIFLTEKSRGVAVADYDNDGDDDFYVLNVAEREKNKLYRNDGNFSFSEVSEESGLSFASKSTMAVWFDANNDGWLDLYVVGYNLNRFYKSNGDGTFSNITNLSGLATQSNTRALVVGDLNGDQRPDLFCHNAHQDESTLYINNGQFNFSDEIQNAGITTKELPSMSAVLLDLEDDGDLDIYCVYDNHKPNKLFRNDGTGLFDEIGEALNLNYEGDGMGVDFADFDHDGRTDLYITNLYPNALLMQQVDSVFFDQAETSNVADEGMGWGTVCLDYNNDSFADIFMVNAGHPNGSTGYTNKLYRNNGDATFNSVEQGSPLGVFKDAFGCASADFDGDGLLDLVITNTNGSGVQVMKNSESTVGNWMKMTLVGSHENLFAVGARVQVWIDEVVLKDDVTVGSGYAGQNSYTLHFGLGEAEMIDSLIVYWPGGLVQKYDDVLPGKRYLMVENESLSDFDVSMYQQALCRNNPFSTCELSQTAIVTQINSEYTRAWKIYPNPTHGLIHLEGELDESTIQVLDLSGKLLYHQVYFESQTSNTTLNLETLKAGVYLIQFISQGEIITERISLK